MLLLLKIVMLPVLAFLNNFIIMHILNVKKKKSARILCSRGILLDWRLIKNKKEEHLLIDMGH